MSSTPVASSPYNGAFFTNVDTRRSWIVPFVIWILWALALLTRYLLGPHPDNVVNPGVNDVEGNTAATTGARVNASGEPVAGRKVGGIHAFAGSLAHRAQRVTDLYRDLLIMIVAALVANTFGSGTTRGTEILSWIYLAFTVLWGLTETVIDNRFIRIFYGFIEFGIILAIFILTWVAGWDW